MRPTGPAAAVASVPMVNLSASSFCAPSLFMTRRTRSFSVPPIRNPKLPPSILIAPGAVQPTPFCLRQDIKPFPYLAPMMKPPFFKFGITITQTALCSVSIGTLLSSMCIMFCSTSVDCFNLVCTESAANAPPASITKLIADTAILFIISSFPTPSRYNPLIRPVFSGPPRVSITMLTDNVLRWVSSA